MGVKGYKVFNPDWTCRGKKYACQGTYKEDGELSVCGHGMHFCKKAADCFKYYSFDPSNHVAEVIAHGNVVEDGDKCCTDHLEIVQEIPWTELLTMVNYGKGCTGYSNTGDYNTGDYNTGDYNTGDWNKSNFNTGCFNTEEERIRLFNKPSPWTHRDWIVSKARCLLNQIPKNAVKWVCYGDMTDEEKAKHKTCEAIGGYLKESDETDCANSWWNSLSDDEKQTIMDIPNFDNKIFKECTGIDVVPEGDDGERY